MSHQEHFFLGDMPAVFTSPKSTVIYTVTDKEMHHSQLREFDCVSFCFFFECIAGVLISFEGWRGMRLKQPRLLQQVRSGSGQQF